MRSRGLILAVVAIGSHLCAEAQSNKSIRAIDFRNFVYEAACNETKISVKNGRFDRTDPDEPMHFSVREVFYGDLKGKGEEHAIVLTSCNLGGTGIFSEGFAFALQDGEPILVGHIEGGDRASGGIAGISIEGHSLKISREFGVALCCANYIETTTYVLEDAHLRTSGNPTRGAARGNAEIKTLRFERGSISGTISGKITTNSEQYSIRARSGQVLEVEASEAGAIDAEVQMIGPDGTVLRKEGDEKDWRFRLPLTGIYDLVLMSNQPEAPYSLKITIR